MIKIKIFLAVIFLFLAVGIIEGINADDSGLIVFFKIVATIISMVVVGRLLRSANNNTQEIEC